MAVSYVGIQDFHFYRQKNPCSLATVKLIGVLRLRNCFAKRSSFSAQDDNIRRDLRCAQALSRWMNV